MLRDYIALETFHINNGHLAALIELAVAGRVEWGYPPTDDDEVFRSDAAQGGIWAVSPYCEKNVVLFVDIHASKIVALIEGERGEIEVARIKD